VVVDDFSAGKQANIEGKPITLYQGDICDQGLLDKATQGVEVVFHLAALIQVQESIKQPIKYFEVNNFGTLNVLESMLKNNVKKIVYFNSASVYESNGEVEIAEDMRVEPKNPYAISKMDGEYLIKMFDELYGLDYSILRVFNPYGTRQNGAGVISKFLDRALKNQEIVVFGNGEQVRDFINVQDVVKAACLCMHKGKEVYNVGSGEGVSLNELARIIITLSDSQSKVLHKSEQKTEVKFSIADISRIKRQLKWYPVVDLSAGISSMISEAKNKEVLS
jgi:UDP-glucose 4-epimerase